MTKTAMNTTSANSITIRLRLDHRPGLLAKATTAIADKGGNIGAIDIVRVEGKTIIRDITVDTASEAQAKEVASALSNIEGLTILHVSDRVFRMHLGGKIEVVSKVPIKTRDDLSMAYTPGVARVCMAIADNPENAWNLTIKRNTVAIVTDGTAVLGLGDIGPMAGMPVMEGKAMLFKEFAGVDAFPICLDTKDPEEIIRIVKAISPGFGGVNLEDISAPRCFEIERRLKAELDIPVFHDDQHGTAVVISAAFLNALTVTGKKAGEVKVVLCGAGAAGTACARMLMCFGVTNLIAVDRCGVLYRGNPGMDEARSRLAADTNPGNLKGDKVSDVIEGADFFIGLSAPGVLSVDDVKRMGKDAVVFAMANPEPEIRPELAQPHVRIMATGRSDFPNQINNVLAFPGIFRGALDCQARDINEEMKVAAAMAIARSIPEDQLCEDYIIPSVFDRNVFQSVASAVRDAAIKRGVARRHQVPKSQS